jgi:threonine/homoserine/homoserine lactone efflux protein
VPGIETLLPFVVATLIFSTLPGPGILYTAAQTMAHGRRRGFLAVAGLHVGGMVHVAAAAAGLSAVFRLVPELYLAIKVAGAIYLVWLGLSIIRNRNEGGPSFAPTMQKPTRRVFLDSIAVEILNPKTALFFIAFLPQFARVEAALPIPVQLLVLGLFVNLCFTAADCVVVWIASAVVSTFKKSMRAQRLIRIAGGTILAGLGVHMALARN